MKERIIFIIILLCSLTSTLSAQTEADSIIIVSAQWETTVTVFITVDGRNRGNATGVSIAELTHLIRVLGGYDALNLDGGGSTTLWLKGAPENGVLNSPSDNGKFDHKGERKIPNIIYVYKP